MNKTLKLPITMFKNMKKLFSNNKSIRDTGNSCSANFHFIEKTNNYIQQLPSFYYVDICNICNLSCVFCPTGQHQRGLSKGMMSKENYAVVLSKIKPYAKQIHLYNWGEPFLNEDIIDIISITAKENIYTAIHSNLTFKELNKSEAEDIVRSGLSFLNVSLDGASQESYEKYRRGGSFERVINNIHHLQEAKEKFNINLPIRWRFLINAFNEHEQERAYAIAKELNVILQFDLMGVQDNSWATKMHDKNNIDEHSWPIIKFNQPVPTEINLAPESPVNLHNRLRGFCVQPFNWMTINVNGGVTPCCSVYGDKYSVGNIFKSEIEEIWNGILMQQCRKFLVNYGPMQHTSSICESHHCGVKYKSLNNLQLIHLAEIIIEIRSGAWKEDNEDWIWLENDAVLSTTIRKAGNLFFNIIFPANKMHQKILPFDLKILLDDKCVNKITVVKKGQVEIKIPVVSGTQILRIISDRFLIPDAILNNGDKRKLSVILDDFKLVV